MSDRRRVGVIVLAAGRSTRFAGSGAHKLLADVGGVAIVRRSVTAAVEAAVGPVVVVTGAEAVAVSATLRDLDVRVVHEPAFAEGMATSLRAGIEAFRQSPVEAIMIGLGDQPGVRAEAYRRVATRWRSSGMSIVIPRYADSSAPAHPVLFAAHTFPELLGLRGDVGARAVVARDPTRVVEERLEWPVPRDVDTIGDLELAAADLANVFANVSPALANPGLTRIDETS